MDPLTGVALFVLAVAVGTYGTIIGAGGGFILVPALVVLFDVTGVDAVGTATIVLAVIGVVGAMLYDREALVARDVAVVFSAASVPAAFLGGWLLAARIDADAYLGILAALLAALAVFVVVMPIHGEIEGEGRPARRLSLGAAGSAVGAIAGTFGVGGGLLTVPAMSRIQRLPPHRATATTQAVAMFTACSAGVGHALAGNVRWDDTIPLGLGAGVGAVLGVRAAGRLAPRSVMALLSGGLAVTALLMLREAL